VIDIQIDGNEIITVILAQVNEEAQTMTQQAAGSE
jgi:hypothetical protein